MPYSRILLVSKLLQFVGLWLLNLDRVAQFYLHFWKLSFELSQCWKPGRTVCPPRFPVSYRALLMLTTKGSIVRKNKLLETTPTTCQALCPTLYTEDLIYFSHQPWVASSFCRVTNDVSEMLRSCPGLHS